MNLKLDNFIVCDVGLFSCLRFTKGLFIFRVHKLHLLTEVCVSSDNLLEANIPFFNDVNGKDIKQFDRHKSFHILCFFSKITRIDGTCVNIHIDFNHSELFYYCVLKP